MPISRTLQITVDRYVGAIFIFEEKSRFKTYAIARPSVVCLSVVCNVRAPYSGGGNFRQHFYGIRYLGHPLTSIKTFYGDRRRGTSVLGGVKHNRGSQI